jgi:GntR family transcriptional regulator
MHSPRSFPLYQWLSDLLREKIAQGDYKPGDALPTEHELMRQYDLSSSTVRHAVNDLAQEGLIYRKAGKGTFVKRAMIEEHLAYLTSFAEEMQTRNIQATFQLLSAQSATPPNDVIHALRLQPDEKVFLIERVQFANQEPIALAQGYWHGAIGDQLAQQSLDRISLYEVIENSLHVPLIEADETISATTADASIAHKLKIQRNAPLLVRRRLTYTSEHRPIEYTTTFYRADRYEYKIRLTRRNR